MHIKAHKVAMLGVALAAVAAQAATREVGTGKDFTDIQSAINAAEAGDTVLVYDGTYEIDAALAVTNAITVKSVNGADATVVKRRATSTTVARVLDLDNASACVEGFAFTGGKVAQDETDTSSYPNAGAGVRIGSLGGTLSGCVVTNNTMTKQNVYGAGIAMLGKDAVVTNCTIMANSQSAWDCKGSGIFTLGGLIVDSDIRENNCSAGYSRGSVYLKGATTMRRCKVVGNTAPNALYYDWGASWHATAGIIVETAGCLIENCLIADNIAGKNGNGGGISIPSASTLVNCTIVGNTAGYGGGVWATAKASFINCIIQGNTALSDANPDMFGSASAVCSNCLSATAFTAAKSSGNIQKTTAFKDGTYELTTGSPAIDAGTLDNQPWLATTLDLNRTNRLEFAGVDIGCYEFHASGVEVEIVVTPADKKVLAGTTVSYAASVFPEVSGATYCWYVDDVAVSTDATYEHVWNEAGNHIVMLAVVADGNEYVKSTSLAVLAKTIHVVSEATHPGHVPTAPYDTEDTAFTSVSEAVAYCIDGMTVKVHAGEYIENAQVQVDKDLRVVAVDGPAVTSVWRAKNTGRAFYVNNSSAFVSGFTVTNITWNARNADGLGFYVDKIGGTVSNCIVRGCKAEADMDMYGQGAYMAGGRMVDCEISDNVNVLSINWLKYRVTAGAGVWLSDATMEHCRVVGNRIMTPEGASGDCANGAGVFTQDSANATIINCLIADNRCDGYGGGIYASDTGAVISNSTVVGNVAYYGAGIQYNGQWTSLKTEPVSILCNTAISGNVATNGVQYADPKGVVAATYCYGPEGEMPAGEGNVFGTNALLRAGTYAPQVGSPLLDAGVVADWMLDAQDLRGRRRVQTKDGATTVDIGAMQGPHVGTVLQVR